MKEVVLWDKRFYLECTEDEKESIARESEKKKKNILAELNQFSYADLQSLVTTLQANIKEISEHYKAYPYNIKLTHLIDKNVFFQTEKGLKPIAELKDIFTNTVKTDHFIEYAKRYAEFIIRNSIANLILMERTNGNPKKEYARRKIQNVPELVEYFCEINSINLYNAGKPLIDLANDIHDFNMRNHLLKSTTTKSIQKTISQLRNQN